MESYLALVTLSLLGMAATNGENEDNLNDQLAIGFFPRVCMYVAPA